ncbi:MAG: UDP-N-acetylmuramoylalanine--D-glutamate ligase [Elusimicrobia bacterium RIFCSPLOWO2_02_FULL_39_32]|nr:MAG: UDP-N-acetylmuramoylalanine--D-glutamate ligase [Elusimicrobia bacterium GWA2_38_7]OGR79262.1 MAG: UDP-N-acetylmuramoylalanine--D-glutamate ligase [Elusimicrobia bacterium RIFCSPHIGHO2_02_FULL_39_36]OGR93162.1 MAG: UDP-N-acetylmuramoylalanine--D-glutamate ligase [Elusimicrobia bacterium RIFCSPLOWO2_02_FULL_39_32]OGR99387.1 MAG: UDP-N-acetylmuramoylalanine--D-glutamate ligase [Elusimicrobia bacterium RIFCSPLOWO2_12_FULL_39_28]
MQKKHESFQNLEGEKLKTSLRFKNVAVLGLGKSGLAVSNLLIKCKANVFLSELKDDPALKKRFKNKKISCEFGSHSDQILKNDLILISPGVPLELPILQKARRRGIPVWNELELGLRLLKAKTIASITGTNGKTTTVSLLADICKNAGRKVILAGNVGQPLTLFVKNQKKNDCVILEVSSYQLEALNKFHFQAACVLNLTNDHLHRHKTMQRYAKIKQKIFLNQDPSDISVLNWDDPWCIKMARKVKGKKIWFSTRKVLKHGVYWDKEKKKIIAKFKQNNQILSFNNPKYLLGLHNSANACASIALSLGLKIKPKAIRHSLEHFKGVAHRLEKVRVFKGISFLNDSKATNVDSTLKALEALDSPLWLILGGEDKGGSYLPLKKIIQEKKNVRGILLIGGASKKIYSEVQGACKMFFSTTLQNAIKKTVKLAQKGETVLLSPACASFDQFKNFEDRGDQFKTIVKNLK